MSSVHDAEQVENAKALFQNYGKPVLGGLIIAVLGYVGWTYWQTSQTTKAQTNTAKVQQLMNDTANLEVTAALSGFVETANEITQDAPNSVQAIQAQLLIANKAYARKDYVLAEQALAKVADSSNDDLGLVALVNLRLANAQFAQEKYDEALATLDKIDVAQFVISKEERKGDIYIAKNDVESAKKSYQAAWDAVVAREEDHQLLRMKLESVGVLVESPHIDTPIIQAQ